MKQLRFYFAGLATALLLAGIFSFSSTRPPTEVVAEKKTHRIVFQLTSSDTAAYRALARQLNNTLDGWPTAQIEVVAHNKGINLLHKEKSNVAADLEALKGRGVRFVACEQTMKQQKLAKADILPLAGFVERGILEVVEKQEQGWAYLKAGF